MYNPFKRIRVYNVFRHFRDYLKLRGAILIADEQHAKDGDSYYVVPSTDGTLLIMDRKNFKKLKQKGYIAKGESLGNLRRTAFYYTPYADGSDAMTKEIRRERAELYYMWCNFSRLGKKHGKGKSKA